MYAKIGCRSGLNVVENGRQTEILRSSFADQHVDYYHDGCRRVCDVQDEGVPLAQSKKLDECILSFIYVYSSA